MSIPTIPRTSISLFVGPFSKVKNSGSFGTSDVVGSPAAGVESPGTLYTLSAGTYTVSENAFSGYTQSFSGDCDGNGSITLTSGGNETCTVTNDDIAAPVVVPPVPPTVVPPTVVPLTTLPYTGLSVADEVSKTVNFAIPSAIFALVVSLYLFRKKA